MQSLLIIGKLFHPYMIHKVLINVMYKTYKDIAKVRADGRIGIISSHEKRYYSEYSVINLETPSKWSFVVVVQGLESFGVEVEVN